MDKNTIVGFVIISLIFIIFSVVNRPSEEELAQAQRRRDSLARVEQIEAARQAAFAEENKTKQQEIIEEKPVADSLNMLAVRQAYGAFADAAVGENDFLTLENNLIKLTLATEGGKIYSAQLKEFQTYDSLPLVLFNGDSTIFSLNFFAQRRSINTNELFFEPLTAEKSLFANEREQSVTMRLHAGEGRYIDYIYTLTPNSYLVDMDVSMHGMEGLIDNNLSAIDLNWEMYIPQKEKGKQNENTYTTIMYKHYQDEVDKFNSRTKKDVQEESIPTRVRWIAFKGQFFSSAIIADESFMNAKIKSLMMPEESRYLKNMRADIGIPFDGSNANIPLKFYFGPNHYNTLKKYEDLQLKELVNLGGALSKWINQFVIVPIFNFLERYISNYGIIILLLTIIIKMALFPLTFKSYLSQAKMRVLKPQIDEINERIPKDKAMDRQQATMALYKKVGINPMGGCLPMLLQMPILFAMFRFFPTSIELRQESFLWAHDLSTYDSIFQWSANIPLISRFYGNHVSLFTLLMTVSTILSMKLNGSSTGSAQMPGMQGMMYVMPVMFMFVLNNFSAGLTYYYFLANLITLGQNAIFKSFVDDEDLLKKLQAKKAKPVKKSKFQQRLEEAAKKKGYNAPKRK